MQQGRLPSFRRTLQRKNMMAANYRHIGGSENRLGRHYSRFSRIWPTAFVADQPLALRKSQNGGSNRRRRAKFTRRTGALLRWQKKRGTLRSVKDPQARMLWSPA